MAEEQQRMYVGVDWGHSSHAVCVIATDGQVVDERVWKNTPETLDRLCSWLEEQAHGKPETVWVAIETPTGPVVERLLERRFQVHAINPKQLDRFRDRFTVAGSKDDRLDARVLADSLRTDARAYRALSANNPLVVELREWSRMHEELIGDRIRECNRLREQLRRYFSQVFELGDLDQPWLLELLKKAPTPEQAARMRSSMVEALLKRYRIRRLSTADVQAILLGPSLKVSPGTVTAASAHVIQLVPRICLLGDQIREAEQHMNGLLKRLRRSGIAPDSGDSEGQISEQRDVEILQSFPGVGLIVLAALLAEAAEPLYRRDYHTLRGLSGVAPVTKRSGKKLVVLRRRACNGRLQNALYHWARTAVQNDDRCRSAYAELRQRGHTHSRALRTIGDRLLKIACSMLSSQTFYDPHRRSNEQREAA
jgi:hypothetical protein